MTMPGDGPPRPDPGSNMRRRAAGALRRLLGNNLHTPGTIGLVFVLFLTSNICSYAIELPILRLVERAFCEDYYSPVVDGKPPTYGPIEESLCKIPEVQHSLALFMGWKATFDSVAPLLLSLWYGSLADRIGRRTVMALACTGELLSLLWTLEVGFRFAPTSIRLAWLGPFFLFIGGGQPVFFAMINITITGLVQDNKRSQYLSVLHAIRSGSGLIGTPLAASLMGWSLEAPFAVIVALMLSRYCLIWFLPETAGLVTSSGYQKVQDDEDEPGARQTSETEQPLLDESNGPLSSDRSAISTVRYLLSRDTIAFTFTCFFAKRIAFTSERLMFQYASEVRREPLKASYWIRIPLGTSATLTTCLILPLMLQKLKQMKFSGNLVNLWVVRVSLIVLISGFGLFWLSIRPEAMTIALILCGAGESIEPALQALGATFVEKAMHSSLFTALGVLDTVANCLGGPLMAAMFGFRNGAGDSYGFCFLLSSVLFGVLLGLSWNRHLRRVCK